MHADTMLITLFIIGFLLFVCWLLNRLLLLFKNEQSLIHLIEENPDEGIDHFDNVVVHEIKYLGGFFNDFLINFSINDKKYTLKRDAFNWLEWPSCGKAEYNIIQIADQIISRYDNDVLTGPKAAEN